MTATAQFDRAAIDEAKDRYNISDIAARWTAKPPQRAGHEKVALCLFHRERSASMRLNDAKGTFHCFGCGSSGDVVTLVMRQLGLDFVDALKWLGAAELPPVDHAARAVALEGQRADRVRKVADARRFFLSASPVCAGDPVDVYLRARGIMIPPPGSIRFGMVPKRYDDVICAWGADYPCMVGACQNGAGDLVGIQRVFFRDNDPALGKADCKLSLGQVKGAALWLGPPMAHINLTEGPEDGLSIMQMMPERTTVVAFGTGLMPSIEYPDVVDEISILGQNNKAGREAVRKAGEQLLMQGYATREAFPHHVFDDWNDWLRGKVK